MTNGRRIRLILVGFLIIAGVMTLLNSFVVVQAGTRAVVKTFGKVTDTYDEGLHLLTPFVNEVVVVDIQIQRHESESTAASKDLQNVSTQVVLNYSVDPSKAGNLVQNIGLDYDNRIIDPAIRESVKAATAQFTAAQLITQRTQVSQTIRDKLSSRLNQYDILVEDLSITDFSFSPEFAKAIEAKQVAEQNSLRAQLELERAQIDAQQQVAQAEAQAQSRVKVAQAEAEALRLQREVISPELLQLRMIEKWNGVMPRIMTGNGGLEMLFNISDGDLGESEPTNTSTLTPTPTPEPTPEGN